MCAAILRVNSFSLTVGVCVHLPDLTYYSKDRWFGVC